METWYCVCFLLILLCVNLIEAQSPDTLENVAVRKPCNQSSIYGNAVCGCAINGNTGTTYQDGDCITKGNCMHTAESDTTPKWTVDLGQIYTIQKITIIGRGGTKDPSRMRNVAVSVDNTVVYTFPPLTAPTSDITDIGVSPSLGTRPVIGRHVTLSRTNISSNGTMIEFNDYGHVLLNICEVQIWVCKTGRYGPNCDQCRPECVNSVCDDNVYPNTCAAFSPCNPNPCQNGGTCQRINDGNPHSYTCHCPPSYAGTNCSTEPCSLEVKPGLCKGYFKRFYYNTASGQCQKFVYGGCGGNGNNFKSLKACKAKCETAGCVHNGVVYAPGQSFTDDCNTCFCGDNGQAGCTMMACLPPQ